MSETTWAQYQTARFFDGRKAPSQTQCDEIARSISGAAFVSVVDTPGSMSYTVVCKAQPQTLVVSFREEEAKLDDKIVQMARQIHGDLVPEVTSHGIVEGAEPPLLIYSMPYLRGLACIGAMSSEVEMESEEEAKHTVFMKHLARYFARCWTKTQPLDSQTQSVQKEGIRLRLARLLDRSILPGPTLSKLIGALPSIFSETYPQVLTHGDFSVTNILIDADEFEITGIVDWSLATVWPFGMDLDILYLTTGYMSRDEGWQDYSCKKKLLDAYWGEFWSVSGIEGDERRARVRELAEAAGQIGAILRSAFQRNPDGSPSEEVLLVESRVAQLRAWFGE